MNIIAMAQQCGDWNGQTIEMNDVGLERFASLVAAAEREACREITAIALLGADKELAKRVNAAIRARGEK